MLARPLRIEPIAIWHCLMLISKKCLCGLKKMNNMLVGGFHQQGRIWDSSRPWLALTLPFSSHVCSWDTLISLVLIYTPPPPHSIPPAHLLKSASTQSVPLWPAHITAFMKERFSCPCRITHFFLSWGLTIINRLKMGLMLKGGNVILCCKIKCFRKQGSFVERRAII